MKKRERDSLEHRVGPEFVEHGGVGHPEQPVDYVDNPVGGGDVGSNDGGVHAATLHGDGLVPPRTLHHVEVELLPVGGGRYLEESVRKLCEGMLVTWRRVTRVNRWGHVRCVFKGLHYTLKLPRKCSQKTRQREREDE